MWLSSATFAGDLHEAVRAKDKGAVESLLIGGVEVDETDFILGTLNKRHQYRMENIVC